MTHSFAHKTVLITGGASGIGRATALAFAQAGARVVVSDIDTEGGSETVTRLAQAGADSRFIPADVSQLEAVAALVEAVVAAYGQLDIAINNAGMLGMRARTADYDAAMWQQVINLNLNGVWYCMTHEIRQMLRQGQGVIVNVASTAGLVAFPGHAAYAASKHAVVGLTKTAALEYVRQGIRINAVCPAFTQTPMLEELAKRDPEFHARLVNGIPARRFATPEEIAAAVLYLCSAEAAFMIGHTLTLDGGITAG